MFTRSDVKFNRIISVVFVVSVITHVAAKPRIQSEKFIERSDILTADPRYGDLKEKTQGIVSAMMKNISQETRSLLGKVIFTADKAFRNLQDDDCRQEASKKLIELKSQTIKDFGECQLWRKMERKSQDTIVAGTRLTEDIQRAAQESLIFCMEKKKSYSIVCRINSDDEASDKFNSLKRKVDQLSASANQIYTNDFQSFVSHCFNENKFNSELEQIKSLCTEPSE